MIQLLSRLLAPKSQTSPLIHHHVDADGKLVWCDESRCRPHTSPTHLLFPPLR